MRRTGILFLSCLLAAAVVVWAQARKPGLWEVTTTQTWQKSPFPGGGAPPGSGTRKMQVCLTQQDIDKSNSVIPHGRGCEVTNVNKKANGMTADLVCTGAMSGKGNVEEAFVDSEHVKGKVHFSGSISMGKNTAPVEWTMETSSKFLSANCVSTKPQP